MAVAVGLIALLTAGSAVFLWVSFHSIRADPAQIETAKLREALVVINDIVRLSEAIGAAAGDDVAGPDEVKDIEDALDFLYARSYAFNRLNDNETLTSVREVDLALEAMLAVGDQVLASGNPPQRTALEKARSQSREILLNASRALSQTVTSQHHAQKKAIAAQTQRLLLMTQALAILLAVFAAISVTAVALLRSELVSRMRREEAERAARFLAYYDQMTGLPNRSRFAECSRELIDAGRRPTLILLDLDDFKRVNDTMGHATGDALLRAVGQRIEPLAVERGGTASRLGGDEFAILLPGDVPMASVVDLCQTIVDSFAEPVRIEGQAVRTGASLGAVTSEQIEREVSLSTEALMRAADYALYKSKYEGRARFHFYDRELAARVSSERETLAAMPKALEDGEFFLDFQPQLYLATGRIHGFEALIRWQRQNRTVPPGEFLTAAEQSGFITELDLWVLRNACAEAASWPVIDDAPASVSVNLSALHFVDFAIVEHVGRCLSETGLDARRLTLEVTETVLIEDWQQVTRVLEALHGLGVEIALDDFGTGYSSLSYLRKLSVDEVKIDRSFVTELETSDETRFLLDAIADIAKGLGMRLVVEGVETEGQRQLLADSGCQIGQGFLFGRPMSAQRIQAMLAAAGEPASAA